MGVVRTFICLDGEFLPEDQLFFGLDNRAFRYGDGLFETLHCCGTRIQFFQDHYARLQKGMELLEMDFLHPVNGILLEGLITRLIGKNRIYGGGRIRISLFRQSGGLYTPESRKAHCLIEVRPLENSHYQLNKQGLTIGLYPFMGVADLPLANLKSISALPYVLAGLHKAKEDWDDCILVNKHGHLIEGISSNLFLVRHDLVLTPSLKTGCVDGIMRQQVTRSLRKMGCEVFFVDNLTESHLLEADEIWFTNAVHGVRWAVAFGDRRYYNRLAQRVIKSMNEEIFGGD